jgi:short subunit dehydrogenase-like uncharacterized protein
MIYGANGYTGMLIAEEAVRRGHTPLLSGRSVEKLSPIAERLGLDMVIIDLDDEDRLHNTVREVDLVLNAAGPFFHTALPIVNVCLETGTCYLDVSGEAMVLEQIYSVDKLARERGIAIIPAVGFNVLASDCLLSHVTGQITQPTHLEIATRWITIGASPGSIKTMIESYPIGPLARRGGKLVRVNARNGLRKLRFLDGVNTILPVTLGDLVTAYRTTQIPNITTYTALQDRTASFYSLLEPILRRVYGPTIIRRIANRLVDISLSRSDDYQTEKGAPQVWVSVRNRDGMEAQGWLETLNSYQFTAQAAVRSVENAQSGSYVGVLTPSVAFGTDFVLEIEGTKRVDILEVIRQGENDRTVITNA